MIGENTQTEPRLELVKNSGNLGARLKAAREAMNLSEKDAASRLHLKTHLIAIMENEDFKNAPPAIFMRGYYRSYARLLNLNEADINQAIEQLEIAANLHKTPETSINIPNVRKPNMTINVRWSTPVVVALLLAFVGMWWHSHSRYTVSDVATETTALAPQPEQSLSTAVALNPQPAAPVAIQTATVTPTVVAPAAAPVVATMAPQQQPTVNAAQPALNPANPVAQPQQNVAVAAPTTPAPAIAPQQAAAPTQLAQAENPVKPADAVKAEPKPAPTEDLSQLKMATDEPGLEQDEQPADNYEN